MAEGEAELTSTVAVGLVKKPLRLCCPLLFAGAAWTETPDLERLRGLFVDVAAEDLFLPATGGMVSVTVVCPLARGAVGRSAWGIWSLLKPTISSIFASSPSSTPARGAAVLCDFAKGGFLVNMSLMFRRPSNSGINLPDIGSMSFVEYSLCRTPCMNIPWGFIKSRVCIISPLMSIWSLMTA